MFKIDLIKAELDVITDALLSEEKGWNAAIRHYDSGDHSYDREEAVRILKLITKIKTKITNAYWGGTCKKS